MDNSQLSTPVLLIIFRRAELTEKIFEAIRQAKPQKLFVAADGPRSNVVSDLEQCAATRAIIERVDWDCEVFKDYSDKNLGVGIRPTSAVHWVFEHVEEAIILEDDCLPNPTFFRFCQDLLEKYRKNPTVMSICGTSQEAISPYVQNRNKFKDSYFFSHYFIPWGWATWKRAWQYHDFELKEFREQLEKSWADNFFDDKKEAEFWVRRLYKHVYNNPNPDSWDYQWQFSVWQKNGLCIAPKANLVSNIGFIQDATHINIQPARPNENIDFPLNHPTTVERNKNFDQLIKNKLLREDSMRKISRYFRRNYYRVKKEIKKLLIMPQRSL
jgi:hypothetical protein